MCGVVTADKSKMALAMLTLVHITISILHYNITNGIMSFRTQLWSSSSSSSSSITNILVTPTLSISLKSRARFGDCSLRLGQVRTEV